MSKVGDMIQEGREKSGLSMRQLADMASVSHSDISRVESGEREVPSPKFLRKISRYIGVNYNDLMYAAGMGAQVSPLNPYLIEYYQGLKGSALKNAMDSIEEQIRSNTVIIESLKESVEKSDDEEKKTTLLTVAGEVLNNTYELKSKIELISSSNISSSFFVVFAL